MENRSRRIYGYTEKMKKGDKVQVMLLVEAEVIHVSNAHGECYKIELPQKDFEERRTIWIDEGEALFRRIDKK